MSSEQAEQAEQLGATGSGSEPSIVPVVGVGASAGGLEALERFLRRIPHECRAAFVVIQHIDPNNRGMLAQLLQPASLLPVSEAVDGERFASGHVYVIPPNRNLSVHGERLQVTAIDPQERLRLPIDHFLRSLADERGIASLGVILTGMGSDGTLGLRAIKNSGGVTYAQDPDTAAFDGMPRSAVETGAADVVGSIEEVADAVVNLVAHRQIHSADLEAYDVTTPPSGDLNQIVDLLLTHTGHDISLYKTGTVNRRIERRMALHQLSTMGQYVRYLRENPDEIELLHQELLIGVTNFFRDPVVWSALRDEVFPRLFAARPRGGELRVWCPACSTGEEAFSLAIVFREALEQAHVDQPFSLRIFATDVDDTAIDRARAGIYPLGIAADVSAERLDRYFVAIDSHYQVSKVLRDSVVFASHDVIGDPPFTHLDLISCRNLLIYLAPELQRRLLPVFHYSLSPGGFLVLGAAERLGDAENLFASFVDKQPIFERRDAPITQPSRTFRYIASRAHAVPTTHPPSLRGDQASAMQLDHVVERVLTQRYAPPAVLANDKGDILFVSGRTGNFLEPPAGRANWNLLAMARDGLRLALGRGFRSAVQSKTATILPRSRVDVNGEIHQVEISIIPLTQPDPVKGLVLVVFESSVIEAPSAVSTKVPAPGAGSAGTVGQAVTDGDVARLNAELVAVNAELRSAYDDSRVSHEVLTATNEELQSTNEELQSTVEELTISMEEMQSMNEELQTLNSELESRVAELTRASEDMDNLLECTQAAALFLDGDLRVRRFTPQVLSVINLRPSDVGRPFTELVSHLGHPELVGDITTVMGTASAMVTEIPTDDGRWFSVALVPYRARDGRIDGSVVNFTDVTASKRLQAALDEARRPDAGPAIAKEST